MLCLAGENMSAVSDHVQPFMEMVFPDGSGIFQQGYASAVTRLEAPPFFFRRPCYQMGPTTLAAKLRDRRDLQRSFRQLVKFFSSKKTHVTCSAAGC